MRSKKKEPKYKAKEKEYYKNNPHKRPPKSRERLRRWGTKRSYYTRQHIFDRDGYDCYICNIPVDLTATHVQGQPGWEMYPHIEHVIPLSLGGDDTLQNVKIAHAKCNMAKGTQIWATASTS
jgi:5-methylcytosine-specific restriction endonuclease McrA